MIGLSKNKEPEKIEQDLLKIVPNNELEYINHLFMWHGRNTCIARNPKCENCSINKYCNFYMNKILKKYKELSNFVNYIRYILEQEEINNSLAIGYQGGGRALVLKR